MGTVNPTLITDSKNLSTADRSVNPCRCVDHNEYVEKPLLEGLHGMQTSPFLVYLNLLHACLQLQQGVCCSYPNTNEMSISHYFHFINYCSTELDRSHSHMCIYVHMSCVLQTYVFQVRTLYLASQRAVVNFRDHNIIMYALYAHCMQASRHTYVGCLNSISRVLEKCQ